jgi:hypothetical protein
MSAGEHRVVIYVKIIGSGTDKADTQALFKFRTPGMNFPPKQISQSLNSEYTYSVELTTNYDCEIEWCYAGGNAYDGITENATPGFHNYDRVQGEIWLYEAWKSDVINSH